MFGLVSFLLTFLFISIAGILVDHFATLNKIRPLGATDAFGFVWRVFLLAAGYFGLINLVRIVLLHADFNLTENANLYAVAVETVLLVGFFLFYLRRKSPLVYGMIEIAFATAGAILAAEQIVCALQGRKSPPAGWLALVAAMYVVVRGLDHASEAVKKRRTQAGTHI